MMKSSVWIIYSHMPSILLEKKECWRLFSGQLHVDCIGEGLRLAKDRLGEKNVYFVNPSFDR